MKGKFFGRCRTAHFSPRVFERDKTMCRMGPNGGPTPLLGCHVAKPASLRLIGFAESASGPLESKSMKAGFINKSSTCDKTRIARGQPSIPSQAFSAQFILPSVAPLVCEYFDVEQPVIFRLMNPMKVFIFFAQRFIVRIIFLMAAAQPGR